MFSKYTPLIAVIVVASVMGYITENIWIAIRLGYLDNRGMLMPGLIGYGIAMVGIYFILGTPQQPRLMGQEVELHEIVTKVIYYIVMSAIIVSVGEILLGNLVEHMCKFEWWNYASLPLHIGKYTSVFTSIGFGSLITLFMNSIFPKIGELAIELCVKGSTKVIWLICLLLVVDFFYEIQYMVKNKKIHKVWKINLRGRWIDRQGHITYGLRG